MTDIVVDASVVVKWYIPEQHHEQARDLRDAYLDGRHELFAPSLLPFEVVNALKYSDHFDSEQLTTASTTLPEYGITLLSYRKVGPVAEVATELDITLYDASYLALATTTEAIVYTADSRLLDAIEENASYSDLAAHIRTYPNA